jgi:hypothetical protein
VYSTLVSRNEYAPNTMNTTMMAVPAIIFAFMPFLTALPLPVCILFEFLQPCIKPQEVEKQAEPDADRYDQHDVELVLCEKIHCYPFDWW